MKKTIKTLITTAAVLAAFSAASADSISLTNTFGGDTDKLSGKDFLVYDEDGNKEDVHVSDRLQLDGATEKVDARVRVDINGSGDIDGKNSPVQVTGYANFKPVDGLNFIAGNKFFGKHALAASYLAATDDFPATGKLAGANGVGFVYSKEGLQLATGAGYESALNLNFGAGYTVKDTVSFGATAQNVTNSDLASYSGYVKLLSVENLFFDAGYSYNYKGGYLANTKHALQFSTGYDFKDAGFKVYFDGLFALTSEYYNATADKTVDYTDKDGDKFSPFALVLFTSYKATENLTAAAKFKVTQAASAGDKTVTTTVYPYLDYKTSAGTVRAGARFLFDDKDGYKGFSIPLSWVYKIGFNK